MQQERIKEIKKKALICTKPFENIEIDDKGNIYSCCSDYTHSLVLGNIFENSFEDIWFGENFGNLRKDVTNNQYSNCILEYCYNIERPDFKTRYNYLKKELKYPKTVTIDIDRTCNARCIFCRNKSVLSDKEKTNKLISMIDSYFIPMLKNARKLLIDGSGEVFCSKFGRQLIKEACKKYPKLKFEILTNGYLCNEKTLKELGLYYNKLALVAVSLHAATKETYQKIVKNIDFDTVIENIKFLSELQKTRNLGILYLTFIVTSLNYKEIPDFIEFSHSLGAIPQVWAVRDYSSYDSLAVEKEKIQSINVLEKSHPEHEKFLEVLQNPVFEKYEIVSDFLFDYNKKMKSFYDKPTS